MDFLKHFSFSLIVCSATMISCNSQKPAEGYIGPSDIQIADGRMTPEVLLSLGRLSDPQISPDGTKILYGVSYTSIKDNRSCRNLFICNADGSGKTQLTMEGKSIDNARWSSDGKSVIYIQESQIWKGTIRKSGKGLKLVKRTKLSDIEAGISEFKLSPDQSRIMFVSTVPGSVKTPKDFDPALDKAKAYVAEDLMYRHWDHWVTAIPHTFIASFNSAENGIDSENSTDILPKADSLFELPLEPFSGIEQLSWSPDGKFIAYSCKKLSGKKYAFSTNTDIYVYNVKTKECTALTSGGGYDTDPAWSPDGKKIAWISMARDGYEADKTRLMVADLAMGQDASGHTVAMAKDGTVGQDSGKASNLSSSVRDLTSGFKYNAAGPVWNESSDAIYFNALAEGLQGIFRASVNCPDNDKCVVRITGEDQWYDFSSPFAILAGKNGSVSLLTSYYSMEFPTELVRVSFNPDDNGAFAASSGTPESQTSNLKSGKSRNVNGNKDMDKQFAGTEDPVNGNRIVKTLAADCHVIDGKVEYKQITSENGHILSQLAPYKTEARLMKTIDGKNMLTWVLYPPKFDSSKTYPSILITLGGPQGTLSQDWSYRWCYRLMAAQGYVVVLPNRRGTTAFGPEWTEQISGDYIGLNMQDYLTAARQMKAEPFIGKMAACGASYGGYSVYYLAGIHGNVFDCFIAHAGIFNEEHMYCTTEEMWFPNWDNGGLETYQADSSVGTPSCQIGPKGDGKTFGGIRQGGSPWSDAPKAIRHYSNSPDKLIQNWHTPILCIHGGNDFRIPYDQGMAAFNAAQMMGVPSKLIVFPDECHWILKPQNALFWHREYFAWLDKWCK